MGKLGCRIKRLEDLSREQAACRIKELFDGLTDHEAVLIAASYRG